MIRVHLILVEPVAQIRQVVRRDPPDRDLAGQIRLLGLAPDAIVVVVPGSVEGLVVAVAGEGVDRPSGVRSRDCGWGSCRSRAPSITYSSCQFW